MVVANGSHRRRQTQGLGSLQDKVMSLGDKSGCSRNFGEIMMFLSPIDPFNAGLFLPVRKQFSKKDSAQLQGY
jgi:hypothetical protein